MSTFLDDEIAQAARRVIANCPPSTPEYVGLSSADRAEGGGRTDAPHAAGSESRPTATPSAFLARVWNRRQQLVGSMTG